MASEGWAAGAAGYAAMKRRKCSCTVAAADSMSLPKPRVTLRPGARDASADALLQFGGVG